MIVTIGLAILFIGAVVSFIVKVSMGADDHREAAYQDTLQSTRETRPRWITAHNQAAEAHLRAADEIDRRQS